MKKHAQTLAILLSMLMLLPLSACGNADNSEPSSASESQNTADQTSSQPEQPVDVLIFATNSHEIETDWGRQILDYWGEQTNTNIKIEQPPADGYQQKLQLLLASGEKLPDLIRMTGGPSDTIYNEMVEEGLALELDNYMDLIPDIINCIPQRTMDAFRVDGKLYQIPLNQSENIAGGTYIRSDWLENLGYDFSYDQLTFDLEEFLQMCRDFTFKDPDGNGKDDTYGLVTPNTAGWMSVVPDILLNACGSGRYWQEDEDGNLTDTILTVDWENTKEALRVYRSMFDEKIVDPEVFLLGGEQVRDKFYRGVDGMVHAFGSCGSGVGFIRGIREVCEDAMLVWCNQITGPNATDVRYVTGIKSTGWVVSSDCENPEQVLKMLNYICTPDGLRLSYCGVPGVQYESIDENLNIIRTEEQLADFDEFFRSRPWQWGMRGEPTSSYDAPSQITNYNALAGNDTYGDIQVNICYAAQCDSTPDLNTGFLPIKSEPIVNMDEEWKTVLQKYLIGEGDENSLDEMRQKYLDGGYQDYIDEANARYQETK